LENKLPRVNLTGFSRPSKQFFPDNYI